MLAAVLFSTLLVGAGGTAAWAEGIPEPAPSPSATTTPDPTPPPSTLTITSPTDGGFSPENSVTFEGEKTAGSSITVTAAGSEGCSVPAADPVETDWSCAATLQNGPDQVVTITETLGSETTSIQLTLDVLGPPSIKDVPPRQSPGVAEGRGYPRSLITLWVEGSPQECSAQVTKG